jgi:tetratricopeptide (TPR) repeat protein
MSRSGGSVPKKGSAWAAFPYADRRFEYPDAALKTHWDRLHHGDCEPYPSARHLARLAKDNRALANSIPDFDGDFAALSERVLHAWSLYHRGDFHGSAVLGSSLGVPGYAAANKATAIYAHYLEENKQAKLKLFQDIAARADQARGILPSDANSHYLFANALGRYSQSISVLEALAQGLGGKVKDALERTLALQPKHAEAHAALGTYHAEVVSKVGGMLARLTYGASREQALEHYERALALHPESAIARTEYANGLLLLFGNGRLDDATRLYVEASELEPCDAMEKLDIEFAKSRLEEA